MKDPRQRGHTGNGGHALGGATAGCRRGSGCRGIRPARAPADGRLVTAAEVANAIVYLASPNSSSTTGTLWPWTVAWTACVCPERSAVAGAATLLLALDRGVADLVVPPFVRGLLAAGDRSSRCRSSTRRILPEIVLGRSKNSDPPDALVRREVIAGVQEDVVRGLGRRLDARGEHHVGLRHRESQLVRGGDDGGFDDGGVLHGDALEFEGLIL